MCIDCGTRTFLDSPLSRRVTVGKNGGIFNRAIPISLIVESDRLIATLPSQFVAAGRKDLRKTAVSARRPLLERYVRSGKIQRRRALETPQFHEHSPRAPARVERANGYLERGSTSRATARPAYACVCGRQCLVRRRTGRACCCRRTPDSEVSSAIRSRRAQRLWR